ncbi:hypothetical protein [Flavobacterium crocinum]|nr:hypothetical protein [Flavobacterium crocinum]
MKSKKPSEMSMAELLKAQKTINTVVIFLISASVVLFFIILFFF